MPLSQLASFLPNLSIFQNPEGKKCSVIFCISGIKFCLDLLLTMQSIVKFIFPDTKHCSFIKQVFCQITYSPLINKPQWEHSIILNSTSMKVFGTKLKKLGRFFWFCFFVCLWNIIYSKGQQSFEIKVSSPIIALFLPEIKPLIPSQ